jgi:hypothetical protein
MSCVPFSFRGEVRDLGEFQRLHERRVVGQMRDDAAIIGPQEVFQRQAGEELVLSVNFFGL